jgi:hypothetical protein
MQQPYRVGLVSLAITLAGAFVWPTETHAVKCLVCTACHNKCDQQVRPTLFGVPRQLGALRHKWSTLARAPLRREISSLPRGLPKGASVRKRPAGPSVLIRTAPPVFTA